jgi:acyl-CoA reductase-like NAD-dependent aldehyde dehydrogenase
VLKPSPFTPLATLLLGDVLNDALPAGVVTVVTGGDDLGAHMVQHPVTRKVSFTGSVGAGVAVNQAAAAGLKRVTLELGGNDPAVVLDDAVLDADAFAKMSGATFMTTGQVCMALKRLYVPRSRYDEVVDGLKATQTDAWWLSDATRAYRPARGVLVVAAAADEAAVEDADEPTWARAMIVSLWGPRSPGGCVIVFRWGHPATRRPHAEPEIRPACCAW